MDFDFIISSISLVSSGANIGTNNMIPIIETKFSKQIALDTWSRFSTPCIKDKRNKNAIARPKLFRITSFRFVFIKTKEFSHLCSNVKFPPSFSFKYKNCC